MSIATEIQRLQTARADIKTAIEEKGVEVGDGLIDTYAEKIKEISGDSGSYEEGYEDGKNSVVDTGRYTKVFQLTSLNVFKSSEVVLNLDSVTSLNSLINTPSEKNTTVKHLTINCPQQVTGCSWLMSLGGNVSDEVLERLTFNVDISKVESISYMLRNVRAVKVIDGQPLDFSGIKGSLTILFDTVPALEDVRVVKESIKVRILVNLPSASAETIQSFVDGLADMTGQTAPTLTVHKNIGEKLTEEQKATITAKNWILAY